jgi:hypothetical protein
MALTKNQVEKKEIQNVVHREREQLEVKMITQPLKETEFKPTKVEKVVLPMEVRPTIIQIA